MSEPNPSPSSLPRSSRQRYRQFVDAYRARRLDDDADTSTSAVHAFHHRSRPRSLNFRVMLSLRRTLFERMLHLPLPTLWEVKTGGVVRAFGQ